MSAGIDTSAPTRRVPDAGAPTGTSVAAVFAKWGRRIVVPVGLLALWQAAAQAGLLDALLFASPSSIVRAFGHEVASGAMLDNLLASLTRVVLGFVIAALVAIPMGMLIGISPTVREYFGGLLEFLRPVPPLALVPVTILWLGIGDASKISIIAYASFWPILLNVTSGVSQISPIVHATARSLNITGGRHFVTVLLPGSMPSIMTGLRVSVGIAIIVVVAAEMVAAQSGLGYAVLQAERTFETPMMYCYIATLAALGVVLNYLLLLLERRLTRWR